MRFLALLPVLALSGTAGASPAPADPFCPALKKIIAAAGETPSFNSVVQPDQMKRLMATTVPAGMEMCRLIRSDRYPDSFQCFGPRKPVATVMADVDKLHAAITACTGVAGKDLPTSAGVVADKRKTYAVTPKVNVTAYVGGVGGAAERSIHLFVALPK